MSGGDDEGGTVHPQATKGVFRVDQIGGESVDQSQSGVDLVFGAAGEVRLTGWAHKETLVRPVFEGLPCGEMQDVMVLGDLDIEMAGPVEDGA